MRNSAKNTLFGDMLLHVNENYRIINSGLKYTNCCNTIGIATKKVNGTMIYIVYKIGEHGAVDWEYEYAQFSDALHVAREKYEHLVAYLDEVNRICFDNKRASTKSLVREALEELQGKTNTQVRGATHKGNKKEKVTNHDNKSAKSSI